MTDDAKARDSLPLKPPHWVQGVLFVGAAGGTLIAMSGGLVWVDTLNDQLTAWGIPGPGRKPGSGIFYLPLLCGVFLAIADRSNRNRAAHAFANGVLWSAAMYLLDPALRVAFYFGLPDFADTSAASITRIILPAPVMLGWLYGIVPRFRNTLASLGN